MSERYVVGIDLKQLGESRMVRAGKLTEPEIKDWLTRCGFAEQPDGRWECSLESLQLLEPDAIDGLQASNR